MLIKNMLQNEYHSSDRTLKQNGVLTVYLNTSLLSHMKVLYIQLVASKLSQTNVIQVQTLKCDFCVPNVDSAKVQYEKFQKNNPYSSTYNPDWKDHLKFMWNKNETLNANQGVQ